jgi:glycosyltransferase involved in cell wall biosynthesis
MAEPGLIVGIDAANLRGGGGVTHLIELLAAAAPGEHGIERVVVWSGKATAAKLPQRPWLDVVTPPALDKGLLSRAWWQWQALPRQARRRQCDVIFAPGGSHSGRFQPTVTMSQNLLPFEFAELRRYGVSAMTLKLLVLRLVQSRSFRRAQAVIFLTDYARHVVELATGSLHRIEKIPHGLSARFFSAPAMRGDASVPGPLRLVYVSIVDVYKHQWQVVEAVYRLRTQGLDVELDLMGPAFPKALARLEATIGRLDPEQNWVRYHGAVPYDEVHRAYRNADIAVFASSCENQPIILLEMMAAGLPIACSNRGPMPEILGEAGVYFDPEEPDSIAGAIAELAASPAKRAELAGLSFARARTFSWTTTARQTFAFLMDVAKSRRGA